MHRLVRKHMFVPVLALAAVAHANEPVASGPLASYVAQADDSFRWFERRAGTRGQTSYAELILTSQTWRDVAWKHQLFIVRPTSAKPQTKHALLVIAGGSWKDELEAPAGPIDLPREANVFAAIAEQLQTPVAVLLHVPHQPMFDGRREDQIIALTFDEFLKTGDPQWLLLLPMVKSAVRGLDAVQEYARQRWDMKLDTFTVCGASKRGWTTWLTGAVDRRVTAIAPMVIDMLKMGNHLKHQVHAWGEISHKIHDYTDRNLHDRLDSDRGRALQQIVDPWSYRHLIKQPKLIMIGTNDDYWPLDSLNLYWDDLVGPKYILYVANQGHGLRDLQRVVGTLNALHQHAARGNPLPKLEWDFTTNDRVLTLHVTSDVRPQKVQAWRAHTPTRDFRAAKWSAKPLRSTDGHYHYEMPIPRDGHAALYGEAVYDGGSFPCFLSTNVRIVGEPVSE